MLLPESYTASVALSPVPKGAYVISIEETADGRPVTFEWVAQRGGCVFTFTQLVGATTWMDFGQWIWVLAPTFGIDTSVDIVWQLRPI